MKLGRPAKPDTVRSVPFQALDPLAEAEVESGQDRSKRLNRDAGTTLIKKREPLGKLLPKNVQTMQFYVHGPTKDQKIALEAIEQMQPPSQGMTMREWWARTGEAIERGAQAVLKADREALDDGWTFTLTIQFADGHEEFFAYDPSTKALTPSDKPERKKGRTFY